MRSFVRFIVAPFALALLFIAWTAPPASAQYYVVRRNPDYQSVGLNLGLDLEGAGDVTPPQSTADSGGGGFKLRIGAEIRRPWLRIIPEGGFGFTHLFVNDPVGNSVGWNMERLFGGVRIGFGEVVVPILYAHVGYGWRASGSDANGLTPYASGGGLTADGGVGLDFHLIRHFGFGIHAEYVTVQAAPAVPDWIAVGAHLDLRF